MNKDMYCHLHNHTSYSMLDGFTRIDGLTSKVKKVGQNAVAITDHGNMSGVPSFLESCKQQDIKGIVGQEFYICPDAKVKEDLNGQKTSYYHITLLARNLEGYQNLVRLSSKAYTEGFYRKPRIDPNMLSSHKRGIVTLSGCVGGWTQQLIIKGMESDAQRVYRLLKSSSEFFLPETMWTGEPDQKKVLEWTQKNFPKDGVLTGDSHYLNVEDHETHDVLFCMGLHTQVAKKDRMRFIPKQYHVKSTEEMYALGLPSIWLQNTVRIADMCEKYDIPKATEFPKFPLPEGVQDSYSYLMELAVQGLTQKNLMRGAYVERLFHELQVVQELDYSDYFLIVADFVGWAKRNGLFVGWGRGSSAGSLLAFALGVTGIDPMRLGLHFERFLNRARQEPPDIDVDFTDFDRPKVLDYIRQKYGEDRVSHIVAFTSLGPRQVIIDTCKALEVPKEKIDEALQHIPYDPMFKVADIKEQGIDKKLIQTLGGNVYKHVGAIAGLPKNMSIHASGILISPQQMEGWIPLFRSKDTIAVQYEYSDLEKLGFHKFDVLGLKTLSILRRASQSASVDLHTMPLDDSRTYDMLCAGKTHGVFQLEGWGYTKFVIQYRPRNFEDIMMINALYRPGPMKGEQGLDEICARRFKRKEISMPHDSLRICLSSTYGVMVYQEQVMECARIIAGFSMEEADILRKAVGKKIPEKIKMQRDKFVDGARRRGHERDFALRLFDDIEFFGRYGWNKAHAASYAMITYATAYMKANHPMEFMCALLNSDVGDSDETSKHVAECNRIGVHITVPHVNKAEVAYTIVGHNPDKKLMAGLTSIRGIGDKSAQAILKERQDRGSYLGEENFRERIAPKVVNKTAFENLQLAGAFKMNLMEMEVPF